MSSTLVGLSAYLEERAAPVEKKLLEEGKEKEQEKELEQERQQEQQHDKAKGKDHDKDKEKSKSKDKEKDRKKDKEKDKEKERDREDKKDKKTANREKRLFLERLDALLQQALVSHRLHASKVVGIRRSVYVFLTTLVSKKILVSSVVEANADLLFKVIFEHALTDAGTVMQKDTGYNYNICMQHISYVSICTAV